MITWFGEKPPVNDVYFIVTDVGTLRVVIPPEAKPTRPGIYLTDNPMWANEPVEIEIHIDIDETDD